MTKDKSPISHLSIDSTGSADLLSRMLQNAHGKIPYNMTNDYMFRAVLQSNNKVLRGLICSLLHLEESEIHSVEITNPIILGQAVDDKEIRLDINVMLNNSRYINLEMQIANKLNWQNRSLLYLSRSFDRLNRGQDYLDLKPAMHIGFLDYTLFPEHPEFYATYKLMNMKNHQVYSDNFVLSVIDLSHTDLATSEDKEYHIDAWVKLFKATTWEEIREMAATNEYLQEASKSIFQFNTDEQIRKLCRDRVEYHQDLHNYERAIAQRDTVIEEQKAMIADLNATVTDLHSTIAEQKEMIADLHSTIAEQKEMITDLNATITDLYNNIARQNITIDDLRDTIAKMSADDAKQYDTIAELHTMVQSLIEKSENTEKN